MNNFTPNLPLSIGCPVWNCEAWAGSVYPDRTPKKEWLKWYSRMFNTVEGNNSFYAIPEMEYARRWAQESASGFRFCMKFPRVISHEMALRNAERETREFLSVLRVLADAQRLGPAFLQLGPDFGPRQIDSLEQYLRALPRDLPFAVEVRHLDWFDSSSNEARLDQLLAELQMDKVLFDSRPLYQAPPDDEIERASQTRKPKTPIRRTATGLRPMLRLVGRNRVELVDSYIDEWLPIIRQWLAEKLEPIIFTHAPDDAVAPQLARRFVERLRKYLIERPVEGVTIADLPRLPARPQQLDLFPS